MWRLLHFIVGTLVAGFLAASIAGMAAPAAAETVAVAPGTDLQPILDATRPGDVIRLEAGAHRGPVTIRQTLTLEGAPRAVLEGDGENSVVRVEAPEAVVRGLTIRGSGRQIHEMDSAVFLDKKADRAHVHNNRMEGNLFGVYIWGPEDALVEGNIIVGIEGGRSGDAGDGVSVWNAPGSKVIGNDVRFGRDGIFVKASKKNVFRGNRFRDLRFAVHYMYTNDSEVSGNVSIDNHVGLALMYSHRLKIINNLSERDRDHGLMFNYANYSEMRNNIVREGSEKCVFIYNANKNKFRNNWFEDCEIGVHFTAGSEGNEIVGNAFVNNMNQVKYVGTRFLDCSEEGRGNYWSDNPAFDLNGDGIADTAYRPNDIIDRVLWTNPSAKVLVTSPAVQAIRWSQSQFPALQPGGVIDSAPLMRPPEVPPPAAAGAAS